MKYATLFAFIISTVSAVPHMHRTNEYSDANYKSDTSKYTDASAVHCQCGQVWNDATSACDELVCEPMCPNGCTYTPPSGSEKSSLSDDHYLGKMKKECRLNNDASCHSCASSSCQYGFGNFWGSGYPCIDLGITVGPGNSASFGDLSFVPMAANGTGNTVTIDAYGNTETIIFCDLDEVHLAALTCSTDKVPVIVSPATCTHCQIARCIKWEDAHRYAAWNPQLDTTGAADFHPEPAPSKFTTKFGCDEWYTAKSQEGCWAIWNANSNAANPTSVYENTGFDTYAAFAAYNEKCPDIKIGDELCVSLSKDVRQVTPSCPNPYLVKIDDSTCWSIWQTLGFGFTSVNDFAIANPGCDALYTGRSLCLTPMNFPACASFATAEAGKGCWDQWNDLADKTSFPDTSSFSNFNTACLTNSVQPGQLLCTKLA